MKRLSLARCVKRTLLSLVAVSLLVQGLFPSGYMPGSLASGWVAVLCPEGLPTAFVRQLNERIEAQGGHAHHHHNTLDGEHAGADASEGSCQLGSALDQPVDVAYAQTEDAGVTLTLSVPLPPAVRTFRGILLAPHSRGPPAA